MMFFPYCSVYIIICFLPSFGLYVNTITIFLAPRGPFSYYQQPPKETHCARKHTCRFVSIVLLRVLCLWVPWSCIRSFTKHHRYSVNEASYKNHCTCWHCKPRPLQLVPYVKRGEKVNCCGPRKRGVHSLTHYIMSRWHSVRTATRQQLRYLSAANHC